MVSGRKPNLERRRLVVELRAGGLSLSEIGQQLGITRQAVHQALRYTSRAQGRVVLCCRCKEPIDPAGILPAEIPETLCLICLAKVRDATFGQKLKAFRQAVGLTRSELAQQSGLTPASIRHYEEGRHYPNARSLSQLAEALGVTPEILEIDSTRPRRRKRRQARGSNAPAGRRQRSGAVPRAKEPSGKPTSS